MLIFIFEISMFYSFSRFQYLSFEISMTTGNAAEHASAIVFAMKNKCNITLGVAVGSSCQIALMVLPLLVLVGWASDKPMSMNLGTYPIIVFKFIRLSGA